MPRKDAGSRYARLKRKLERCEEKRAVFVTGTDLAYRYLAVWLVMLEWLSTGLHQDP
mgnify:CR=1 FL=1